MKKEQIQRIKDDLKCKTGVDLSRYQSPELTESVSNALTFPLYFARSVSRPVGLFLLTIIIAMVVSDSGYFRTFLGFPGLVLAVINGFVLGLVLFVRRIRNDMETIFTISADLSMQVVRDIGETRRNLQSGAMQFPSLLEIFQGANAVIILPIVIGTLERKVPLFGGIAARVTNKFFSLVDSRLAAAVAARGRDGNVAAVPASPEQVSAWLDSAERMVDTGKGLLSQVVGKVAKVVAFPFLVIFLIVFLLSALVLYGAYAFMG